MTTATQASGRPAPVESVPIQPRDSFKCPSWCAQTHTEDDLSPWEYGQWLVRHKGETHTWLTSHGSEMEAQLTWVEIVGSSAIVIDGEEFEDVGPVIKLGGEDGSGFMGTNEVVAADVSEWSRVFAVLAAEVTA